MVGITFAEPDYKVTFVAPATADSPGLTTRPRSRSPYPAFVADRRVPWHGPRSASVAHGRYLPPIAARQVSDLEVPDHQQAMKARVPSRGIPRHDPGIGRRESLAQASRSSTAAAWSSTVPGWRHDVRHDRKCMGAGAETLMDPLVLTGAVSGAVAAVAGTIAAVGAWRTEVTARWQARVERLRNQHCSS
jgi:hypothetical protein